MSFNKKAILGEVTVTFWATVILVVILILFIALSGFMRVVSLNKGGTMIRQGTSEGVGDIFLYSNEFESLNELNLLLKETKNIDLAKERISFFVSNYVGNNRFDQTAGRTLFKSRDSKWFWSYDGLFWIPAGKFSLVINGEEKSFNQLMNSGLAKALKDKNYEQGALLMKDYYACNIKEADLYTRGVNICPEIK